MDGANMRFMQGKETWLRNHLILYNVANSAAANPFADPTVPTTPGQLLRICQFDLRKIGTLSDSSGNPMKAYELHLLNERETGFLTHALNAYFLPWGSQSTYQGRLGNGADFFFTPTMNGCTFAVQGAVNPLVIHSNYSNPATQQIDQGRINTDVAAVFGGAPDRMLDKGGYKVAPTGTEDYRVTMIGIRSNTGWNFYYQRYQLDMADTGHGTQLVYTPLDRVRPL